MTDARMPSRWLTDPALDRLSDHAWRTFTGSLMWSAGAGTDGAIPATSLRFLHPEGVDDLIAAEVITAGLWAKTTYGYQVVDWERTQSLAADIEQQREANRLRQAAWRVTHKQPVTGDVTRDITGDVTRESHRQGQARQGQALKTQPPTVLSVGETPCVGCQRAVAFATSCPEHGEAIA